MKYLIPTLMLLGLLCITIGAVADEKQITLSWDSVCLDVEGNPEDVSHYIVEVYDDVGRFLDMTVQDEFDENTCGPRQSVSLNIDFLPEVIYRFDVKAVDFAGNVSEPASIEVDGTCKVKDIRDVNADNWIDISDPITILLHLFRGLQVRCEPVDPNEDGSTDISDALFLLNLLFRS